MKIWYDMSRQHHVSWEALICKHKQIQWAIGWKIIVFNLLSRPPEPDFIEASRLIAGLLVGKLAFDEVWCQGAAKFPSNYLLARAPQLFTFRTQHVDQTTSYNQRDEFIRRVVIIVLNELLSCLVILISSNFGIHFLDANNGWAWWKRWSE